MIFQRLENNKLWNNLKSHLFCEKKPRLFRADKKMHAIDRAWTLDLWFIGNKKLWLLTYQLVYWARGSVAVDFIC